MEIESQKNKNSRVTWDFQKDSRPTFEQLFPMTNPLKHLRQTNSPKVSTLRNFLFRNDSGLTFEKFLLVPNPLQHVTSKNKKWIQKAARYHVDYLQISKSDFLKNHWQYGIRSKTSYLNSTFRFLGKRWWVYWHIKRFCRILCIHFALSLSLPTQTPHIQTLHPIFWASAGMSHI